MKCADLLLSFLSHGSNGWEVFAEVSCTLFEALTSIAPNVFKVVLTHFDNLLCSDKATKIDVLTQSAYIWMTATRSVYC